MEIKKDERCFITYFDCDGDEYTYTLTPGKVSGLMHAINSYRAHYCVYDTEFKILSSMFDWFEFVYDDEHNTEDDECPFPA